MYIKAKKSLGQHFLNSEDVALRTIEALTVTFTRKTGNSVLEVGPGTGILTKYLLQDAALNFKAVELDGEAVEYLLRNYPDIEKKLFMGDFLKTDLDTLFPGQFSIIGNFPYNISSQIFFKILDYREKIPTGVGMVQKEVAERLASPPCNKSYGILSVLLQAWYDIEYLFTVEPHLFTPPPKVKSAVIRIRRNRRKELGCNEALFKTVVKTCFNQRRKTIRNSIKPLIGNEKYGISSNILNDVSRFLTTYEKQKGKFEEANLLDLRPEQLSVEMFVKLINDFC